MKRRFSWLHLTDFHFGLKGQNCLWPTLREPFLEDLTKLHDLSGPWNSVFFTGDFVQSGSAEQFAEMQSAVLDRLWEKLRELGSGDAVLLAVPGNHDLERPDPKVDDPAVDGLLNAINFDAIAEKFWNTPDGAYRRVITSAFAAYSGWWKQTTHRPNSDFREGLLPGDFACTLPCGEYRIGIIGLNTTFLQLQGGDFKKRLVWNPRQIHQVTGGAVDDWLKNHNIALLLTHQGPDWLTPESEKLGATEIAPPGRFAAHFFGHMHETKLSYLKIGGGEVTRECQGSSVFGMEKYGEPPTTIRTHGYAAGYVEFSELGNVASFRVWPRVATSKIGPWRFIPDYDNANLSDDQGTHHESISVRRKTQRLSEKVTIVSQTVSRSNFVAIPKLTWPADLPIEMPDSMLLRPESRVVRFHHLREPLRDTIIGWAIDPDEPIKLRLQAGEGGSGKTRLLIEVCDKLEQAHGWRAGFMDKTQSIESGFSVLLAEGQPCLVVVDYAESRTTEIVDLVRTTLSSKNIPLVRFVLLAREGGDWWDRIAEAARTDYAAAAILRGVNTKTGPYRMAKERIEPEDRHSLFQDALQDFSNHKNAPVPSISKPDLSSDFFGTPLFIHLSALAHVQGQPNQDGQELLSMALGHERSFWRRLLDCAALPIELLSALEQAVALLTLSNGGRSARQAKELLNRTPRLRELRPELRTNVFDLLRKIYPMEGGLMGLQPDLLGETLVSEALAQDDELLDVALGAASGQEERRYALTVLTRLARRIPSEERWLKRALERNLIDISDDALSVGVETGSPMPKVHAEVLRSAERGERRQAVEKLRSKLPKETTNLAELTVEIRRQTVSFLDEKKSGNSAKRHIALSEAFSALAFALRGKGLLVEAANAASEAARYATIVFRSDSVHDRSRLADVLANVAGHFGEVGRFGEGLEAAEKAENIRRKLAEKQPSIYTAAWASALSNLAGRLSDVGRLTEGLQAAERAEHIHRSLAKKQPSAHNADWAISLSNLASHLSHVGRFEDGLKAAEQAERLRCDLAEEQPDIYIQDWATSLNNLAGHLREVGRFEEGLKAAEQAERLRRNLAEKQPDAHTADWATSLSNLAGHLSEVGRFEEGLKVAEQAERLRCSLAEKQPDAYTADWAVSLNNLASHLSEVGRLKEALTAAEQAERLRRSLAEKQPHAYTAVWASSLNNLAGHFGQVGRFEESLKTAQQAERLRRKLAEEHPDAYTADWATSLRNLANRLSDLGRFDEGLKAAEQAERLRRELAAVRPNPFTADWAESLSNLGTHLSYVGRFEDGLKAAEQAERLRRELATRQPDVYTADWATSLSNLASHLSELGRFEEGLKAAEHAELLQRGLAERQPDAYAANWATTLLNLGGHLTDVGRLEEGLRATAQAERLQRGLAKKQPDTYTAHWATSLSNLASHLNDVGRFEEGLQAAEQAELLRRGLVAKQPDAYTADWATSLSNLAESLVIAGQFAPALDAAKAAIEHIKTFAERYPRVYNPWLGYGRRILAESLLKMEKLEEAAEQARKSAGIWTEIAKDRQNFEALQIAKTFRILITCEIALGQREAAISVIGKMFSLLRRPLEVNPKLLQPLLSEVVDLGRTIDGDAVVQAIPNDLLAILNSGR
jgi:hypothetical protein